MGEDNIKVTDQLIRDIVVEVVGEDVIPVVEYLKNRENVSEFKIAEDIDCEVNRIRRILYRLYDKNLVSYRRKKDKIKGWSISYWTFNKPMIKHILRDMKRKRLMMLKERLQREEEYKGLFYICSKLCSRMDFDTAFLHNFKCPECGSVLEHQDNSKTIERLKEQLKEYDV